MSKGSDKAHCENNDQTQNDSQSEKIRQDNEKNGVEEGQATSAHIEHVEPILGRVPGKKL